MLNTERGTVQEKTAVLARAAVCRTARSPNCSIRNLSRIRVPVGQCILMRAGHFLVRAGFGYKPTGEVDHVSLLELACHVVVGAPCWRSPTYRTEVRQYGHIQGLAHSGISGIRHGSIVRSAANAGVRPVRVPVSMPYRCLRRSSRLGAASSALLGVHICHRIYNFSEFSGLRDFCC